MKDPLALLGVICGTFFIVFFSVWIGTSIGMYEVKKDCDTLKVVRINKTIYTCNKRD